MKPVFVAGKCDKIFLDVTKADNGERRTGNREQESGNECTTVTRLRIQNGGQRERNRVQRGEM